MNRRTFTTGVVSFLLSAHGVAMASPKSECEDLMDEALPLAERMLREHGEFYPYGLTLDMTGKVAHLGATDGTERPASAPLIKLLTAQFEDGAKAGKYRATALVYDVRVLDPSKGAKSDAIAVALDHRESYSVVVFVPYTIQAGKYRPGKIFAQKGEGHVFR
jgi:hypothetical protein